MRKFYWIGLLVLLAILPLMAGCSLLARWISDVRKPIPLSPGTILQITTDKGWDTERLLLFSESGWRNYFKNGVIFPQVYIYDQQGRLLYRRQESVCDKGFPEILDSLITHRPHLMGADAPEQIQFSELPGLRFRDGSRFEWNNSHSYYIFTFWAWFAGRTSKWVDSVEHILHKAPEFDALHFYVNCDIIEW